MCKYYTGQLGRGGGASMQEWDSVPMTMGGGGGHTSMQEWDSVPMTMFP